MVDTGHATRGGRRNSWGWGGLSAFIVACLLWTGPAGAQVPTVTAIERLDASPTAASTVRWLVRFSEDVSGVDANDFCLNTAGLSGAAIVRAADPLGAALAPNGITYATNHPGLNAHRSPAAELAAGLTVEAWIRSDTALGTQTVVSTQHSGGSAGWSFQVVDGALRFVAHGAHTSDSSAGVIVAGRWQHVAVVFDAAHTAHFYVDGLAAGAVGQSSAVQPTGQGRVFVGSRFVNQSFASTQTAVDPFAGLVDEVRVWSVERTPAELDAARWLPLAGTETGLIGYWPFDGDFDDRSPNGAALHGPFRSEAAILAYETNRAMTLVTAALRTGDGEVGLRVCDDGSIVDADANPLGGAGAGNGEAVGPVYEVERGSVVPVTYVVNTLNDENDGVATGSISLRDALAAAQTATAPVVIDLTQQVGVIDIASNGMLPGILEGTWVEVVGPGASALEVSGDLAGSTGPRLLFVDGGYLSVSGLGLRGGLGKGGHGSKSAGGGAGIGGALFLNRGHVAATAVAFSQNRAIGGNGGGMTDPTTTAVRMGGGGGLGGDGQPGFDGTSFAEITDPATLAAIQDCGQRDDYFAGGVGGDGSPLLDESPGIPVLDVRVLADPPVDVITPWLLYGFCGHRSGEGAGGVGLRDDRISRSGSSRDPGFYGGRPGGIFGGGGGGSDHNSLTISQGNTDANMAGAGGYGGGGGAWMFIDAQGRKREGFGGRYGGDGSGAPRNTGGGGGGAGLGGAVFVRQGAQLVCRQCAFSGNSAAGGAGGGPQQPARPGQRGGAVRDA